MWLESLDPKPIGKCWRIQLKQDVLQKGSEPCYLNLRLQLLEVATHPDHEIEWAWLSGKYLQIPKCNYAAIFSSTAGEWLTLIVKKLDAVSATTATSSLSNKNKIHFSNSFNKTKPAEAAMIANEKRTNEERVEEGIQATTTAVVCLRQKHSNWNELGTKQRIALIQEEVKTTRGIGISQQTLYRDWIKPLWWKN